jgi:hypothetical protein
MRGQPHPPTRCDARSDPLDPPIECRQSCQRPSPHHRCDAAAGLRMPVRTDRPIVLATTNVFATLGLVPRRLAKTTPPPTLRSNAATSGVALRGLQLGEDDVSPAVPALICEVEKGAE